MDGDTRSRGATLRFYRAVSPERVSLHGHGTGGSTLQRKTVAARARKQTEAQAGVAGRFGDFARAVSIGVSNDFGSFPGHFVKTLLTILDLRTNFLRKAVGQNSVVARVVPEEHERMAREFREFVGSERPVEIADGKECRLAETRTDIGFDLGRRHLLVDSGSAAHFFRKAAALSAFAIQRVPPKSLSLLDVAGRNEEDGRNVEFFEKRNRACVVEVTIVERQKNAVAFFREFLSQIPWGQEAVAC